MLQLHEQFPDSRVKELTERYLKKAIERGYIKEVLGIGKRGFCPHKSTSPQSERVLYSLLPLTPYHQIDPCFHFPRFVTISYHGEAWQVGGFFLFDARDNPHFSLAFRTGERVRFIDLLDQSGLVPSIFFS